MDSNYLDVYLPEKWVRQRWNTEIYNSVAILKKHTHTKKTILTLKNLVKDSENLWLYAFFFCKILTSLIYNSINYLPISAHITLKQDKNIAAKGAICNSSTWHLWVEPTWVFSNCGSRLLVFTAWPVFFPSRWLPPSQQCPLLLFY